MSKNHETRQLPVVPGTSPGTLRAHEDMSPPVIRVLAYGPERLEESEIEDLGALENFRDRYPVVWVNVEGLGDVDLLKAMGEVFGLHNLALEDVLSLRQRPKADTFDDHLFLVTRMLSSYCPIRTEQLCIFLRSGVVLTFQERSEASLDPIRERIRMRKGKIRDRGADYLTYALLDAVVDEYYAHLEELSNRAERLEEQVLHHPDQEVVADIHAFRRDLLTLRRVITPQREVVNTLLRDEDPRIDESTRVYIRDLYDHTIHVLETVETYREIVSSLLDLYLSSVSNRMNEVMKVLAIIGTVFIPLGFLAGVYGMNFDTGASRWNLPELGWAWGYPLFLLVAAGVAATELFLFWRWGWLGSLSRRPKPDSANRNE